MQQVDIERGLSTAEVERAKQQGLCNYDTSVATKTIPRIIRDNIFTLFNLLNFGLAACIFMVQAYKNLLFLGVVICNTIISTVQEIHAKKVVDKLSIIAASKTTAIRNGKQEIIEINEIVMNDILEFHPGNQVVTDSIIRRGSCEVDESFITGESDPVFKKEGDLLLSGSFIISGHTIGQVKHVGLQNYTATISKEATQIKHTKSVLMDALNHIIKIVSIAIVPIGILLFLNQSQIDGNSFRDAVVGSVAAIIGMIPEGLVLLTSTVLAVSVIRLSKRKVLVKDLYCIESLARIDTLCLEKTGTLTTGTMKVVDILPYKKTSKSMLENTINAMTTVMEDNNPTMLALKEKFHKKIYFPVEKLIPFSSDKKYSGVIFQNKETYYIGAPEFVLGNHYQKVEPILSPYLLEYRILVVTKKEGTRQQVLGFILLQDNMRSDVEKTLTYFKEEGVSIKVISGDHVKTVSGIAKRAGIEHYDQYIDMSKLTTDEEIYEAAKKYTVFGRVNPIQKKKLVIALKEQGHYVGMTGDGINDVLALKEADCSIAMPNGSDATRNISQLVLLDGNFSAMPKVVAEGRRTVNNIENSATLFLTKTTYATILAVLFVFLPTQYPFIPIQLTLTSVVTIGIPSFVLALQPNKKRITGNFYKNVLSRSLPAALIVVTNIILIMILAAIFHLPDHQVSTLCVMMNAVTGFYLLFELCRPFNKLKTAMYIAMIILFVLQVIFLKELYSLSFIHSHMLVILIGLSTLTIILFQALNKLIYNNITKYLKIDNRISS